MAGLSSNFDQQKLRLIVRKHLRFLGRNEVLPDDQSLYELGLDSLTTINLLLDLEKAFQCTFPDHLLNEATFQSLNSLRAVVAALTENTSRPMTA